MQQEAERERHQMWWQIGERRASGRIEYAGFSADSADYGWRLDSEVGRQHRHAALILTSEKGGEGARQTSQARKVRTGYRGPRPGSKLARPKKLCIERRVLTSIPLLLPSRIYLFKIMEPTSLLDTWLILHLLMLTMQGSSRLCNVQF